MAKAKKKVVVVCPGRGSYAQKEMGYLKRYSGEFAHYIDAIDGYRRDRGEVTVSEMDQAEKFSAKLHTPGENASPLIYACSLIDFLSIDKEKYEISAITGNSMGWYLTLGFAGALTEENSFKLINTMGSMMKEKIVGGQIIYPLIDDDWVYQPSMREQLEQCMEAVNKFDKHDVFYSIHLGGYAVLGGDESGLRKLSKMLPPVDDTYPMKLLNHAAFHTPLLKETSAKGFEMLGTDLFRRPEIPMVDGRGHIWQPYSTDPNELREYTLGHQVYEHYDYTAAIRVSLKEFVPDHLILLGPGSSLGGATAQVMIAEGWKGLTNKTSFQSLQKTKPFVLAMGREDQRELVTKK